MGMTEEFETSLQVLRGFDTDISVEVNDIKVSIVIVFFYCNKVQFIQVLPNFHLSYDYSFHRDLWHQQAKEV